MYRKLAELKYDRYIGLEFMYQGDPVTELRNAREQAIAAMEGVALSFLWLTVGAHYGVALSRMSGLFTRHRDLMSRATSYSA